MTRWKLIIGIALVFFLGALAGSIGTGYYLKSRYPFRIADHKARKAFILEKFSKELNLTQDQKIKVENILEQIEKKRQEYLQKNRAETETLMDQMRSELNSDQQKKFDALREKFEKRRKARAERQIG
jgi:Spy/CpxP family protein refolding chaperone